MEARARHRRRCNPGTRVYVVREGLELCLVLGGLAIADWLLQVPFWVWIALPIGKCFLSVLFYALFLRQILGQRPRHEPASLVGRTGHTLTPLNPDGQIRINGEIWSARSCSGDVIPPNHAVVIREACGSVFLVEVQTTDPKLNHLE